MDLQFSINSSEQVAVLRLWSMARPPFLLRSSLHKEIPVASCNYSIRAFGSFRGLLDVFDRMPDYLCLYILGDQRENLGKGSYVGRFAEMRSIFCGEHVLVYNCFGDGASDGEGCSVQLESQKVGNC